MDFRTLQDNVASIAKTFAADRPARQLRRHLETLDFDQLRAAGLPLIGLPAEQGGLWVSVAESTRPISETLRTLARGDSSVALVCAMHPAVLSYWLTAPAELSERPLWQEQCEKVFSSVREGSWWGTITSEPGSGGDITQSRTDALHGEGETAYFISGLKHFGSGTGIMGFMVSTAIPEGADLPEWFFVDLREVAWDGSQGVTLTAEWDGHGMIATQSHSLTFDRLSGNSNGLVTQSATGGGERRWVHWLLVHERHFGNRRRGHGGSSRAARGTQVGFVRANRVDAGTDGVLAGRASTGRNAACG